MRDGDDVVLRGAIPAFATPTGATLTDSTATFHAGADLNPVVSDESAHGRLDVRTVNGPHGTQQRLRFDFAWPGGGPGPFDVVALDDVGAAFPLGTIVPGGRLILRQGFEAIAGRTIEIRAAGGLVLARGVCPSIP